MCLLGRELLRFGSEHNLTYIKGAADSWLDGTATKLLFIPDSRISTVTPFLQLLDTVPLFAKHGVFLGISFPRGQFPPKMIFRHNGAQLDLGVDQFSWAIGLLISAMGGGDVEERFFHALLASHHEVQLPLQSNDGFLLLLSRVKNIGITCMSSTKALAYTRDFSPSWKFFVFLNATDVAGEAIMKLVRYWQNNALEVKEVLSESICDMDLTLY